MGEVWVAQQTQPVKRRLAVKLIRAGMGARAFLARFQQERQALAMMVQSARKLKMSERYLLRKVIVNFAKKE